MYDCLLIDECGQATEPSAVGVGWRAKQLVLCGDHQQLPPTTRHALLKRSLLERMSSVSGLIVTVLDIQYRMLPEIARWPSDFFYAGQLKSFRPACSKKSLLSGFHWPSQQPLAFVHVSGQEESQGTSFRNMAEVHKIEEIVDDFLAAGVVTPADIGVITPYIAQRDSLSRRLPKACTVGSVDSFQGREQKVIILSLVRSNERSAFGFYSEARRLNVALTRAQDGLIIVGDGPFWYWTTDSIRSLLDHIWAERAFVGSCDTSTWSPPSHKVPKLTTVVSKPPSTGNAYGWLRLSETELLEVRRELQLALQMLWEHPCFVKLWPYVMQLPAHKYGVADLPQDFEQWDRKAWSHLCKLMGLGMTDDPGNECYLYGLVMVALSFYQVPSSWDDLQKYRDVEDLKVRTATKTGYNKLLNDAGDMLECLGGLISWDSAASRDFCRSRQIEQSLAREGLAHLSTFMQKVNMLCSLSDRSIQFGDRIDFMLVAFELSGSLIINSSWSEPANTSSAQDRVSDNMRSAQDAEPWSQPANTSSAQDRVPAKKRPAQDFLSADSDSVEGDQQEVGTSSSSSHMVTRSPATLPANTVIRIPATLPAGDSRFLFRRKQRIYVCDNCGSSNGFKKQSLPYDGTFLHRNWKEGIEPHQLETMYLDGDIDATWWCSKCMARSEGTTQQSVRWAHGLYQVAYRKERTMG